ncbi:pentapeptide repeat-containing protein [Streptomyces sp. SID3212]|uniref:pentapeptide repeat-containing protein n=1 Tax=Streptomyces sp. SID3212 TaxID=2690259 RepID=UPI00136AD9AA|nr:pentapeptide repeat-containing protein [Streptomyces sp. SID3212]MYV51648.1 pentapeptide repeat-containing protein [Streptomyces sp. SID3212]
MTPAASEPISLTPPSWEPCGRHASSADPVGCRGILVGSHTACLAHLNEAVRDAYFATLSPGADIDHRGTPFSSPLLRRLLAALQDPATGKPRTGQAYFNEAAFSDEAWFSEVTFSGHARFAGASFSGSAHFGEASFSSSARFDDATFSNEAWFSEVTFSGHARFAGASFSGSAHFGEASFSSSARFDDATFSGDAWFEKASFAGNAWFGRATFAGHARFGGASFSSSARFGGASFLNDARFSGTSFTGSARFGGARFETASRLGPLVCGKTVVLDAALFQQPVTVEIAARQVSCARTRWASTATLHLRYAELDLRDAVLEYPVLVSARPVEFSSASSECRLPETELSGLDPGVRLESVSGVDAAHLALHDIDLSRCRFAGAVHLDQLRVDGWCTFAATPTGREWRFPWRWSRRNTLVEEHHWRVRAARHPERATALGWTGPPQNSPDLKPAAVAALYRQLRKSMEDGKNEPDAADFYYGESEMRRKDLSRPWGERVLLTLYWALSGYGLRATRALAWLGFAMTGTIAVMTLWGLPVDDPKPTTTGHQVTVGQTFVLTTDTPDPVNPTNPLAERINTERGEKALRVVVNSVVFRSSGQDLTTAGTYTEMTSRLIEPALLGLAVLAVRSRVKR